MTIQFLCSACGKQLRVDDKFAGRRGTCPNCGMKNRVPEKSDLGDEPVNLEGTAGVEPPRHSDDDHGEALPVRKMREIDHEDLIDMTAMVDIVFFLLIYFLVTSFQALDSSLPLPAPQATDALAATEAEVSDSIVVRIEKDDSMWIEDLRIEGDIELAAKLRELHETVAHPEKVEIVASGDASHGAAVIVLDSAKHAGINKFSMRIDDEMAGN